MADLTHERVRAYFDQPDLGKLAVGQKIIIKWTQSRSNSGRAIIERIPVTVNSYETRTVGEVLVHIDDSSSGLLPNTTSL